MKKTIDSIPAKAMATMTEYHWPRQRARAAKLHERAVILSRGAELEVSSDEFQQSTKLAPVNSFRALSTLEESEREHIVRVPR